MRCNTIKVKVYTTLRRGRAISSTGKVSNSQTIQVIRCLFHTKIRFGKIQFIRSAVNSYALLFYLSDYNSDYALLFSSYSTHVYQALCKILTQFLQYTGIILFYIAIINKMITLNLPSFWKNKTNLAPFSLNSPIIISYDAIALFYSQRKISSRLYKHVRVSVDRKSAVTK